MHCLSTLTDASCISSENDAQATSGDEEVVIHPVWWLFDSMVGFEADELAAVVD